MKAYQKFLFSIFKFLFPSKIVRGKENIPEGGAIIACNHFSILDCGYIRKFVGEKSKFIAKKETFDKKIGRKILGDFGAIPINRDKPELSSLLRIMRSLKNDEKLVIFPEGTRNKTGKKEMLPFKRGVALFALKSKCPVVPVMINRKGGLFKRVKIVIGKPIYFIDYYDKEISDEILDNLSNEIRRNMEREYTFFTKN